MKFHITKFDKTDNIELKILYSLIKKLKCIKILNKYEFKFKI